MKSHKITLSHPELLLLGRLLAVALEGGVCWRMYLETLDSKWATYAPKALENVRKRLSALALPPTTTTAPSE